MKLSRPTSIALVVLLLWLVFTWRLGIWLGLHPPMLYYLRAGLWLLGFIGLAGYFFFRPRGQSSPDNSLATEVRYNFGEASTRMASARGVKQLGSLPAVFVLGDTASAKTSIIARSGLEPELLAGFVYQDNVVAPTRSLNIWFARDTLFIDPAGAVTSDPGARRSLWNQFAPVRLRSAFSSQLPPPRSVVFTVDCETIFQAGGADALASRAREFHAILTELSSQLGSSFPVYVVFTKADKVAYFRDYVETFTTDEAASILGVTLPLGEDASKAVYAEAQTRRLTVAFQDLYYELCRKRPIYLARENDAAKLPNIYEFPREFAKLRALLIQFLVDICKPSQLGTSPFLRGFYFTGVRPVTVTDLMPAAQAPIVEDAFDTGATRIFRPQTGGSLLEAQPSQAGSRRVPQWVFLGHLFSDIILADAPATAIAQSNVKVNLVRRALYASAAAFALAAALWWTVSYRNNKALVNDAVESARAVPSATLSSGQVASLDSLRRLTRVRDTLALLTQYDREGVPFRLSAFLYSGDALKRPLEATYYALFRKLLLAPTQENLVGICAKPETYETQGYGYLYNTLKSYLITTNHHEKSSADFLTPVLLQHWDQNGAVDSDRQDLARKNFDFYADELRDRNPYPRYANPDANAVETARAYLKHFKQEDRIYAALLAEAAKGQKPIVFNTDYPGSAETVINKYRVEPGYTRPAALIFAKEVEDPTRYFSGEEWVLGEALNAAQDRVKLKADLIERYAQGLTKTWTEYLNATSVVGYGGVPDAALKLGKMSGPQSSLLQVLCVASENTKSAPQSFQPVQFVTPPGCSSKLVGPANNGYMQSLIALSGSLGGVGPIATADPNLLTAANANAGQAENAVSNLALNFTPDPADPRSPVLPKTAQILRDPITRVAPLLKVPVGLEANKAAAGLCEAIKPMLNKYPFNPRSQADATLQEVSAFLKPGEGQLWQVYNNTDLKKYLLPAGAEYVRAPGQQGSVTPAFLNFFNRAARMSQAMFKGEGGPSFTFSMQALPSQDVSHVTLNIDGQTLSTDLKGGGKSQTFNWPGTTPSVALGVSFGGASLESGIVQTSGLWAVWHFIDTGERLPSAGSQLEMQWVEKTSAGIVSINGHPASVKFALDPQSSLILRPQYFSGLACTSKAVQ